MEKTCTSCGSSFEITSRDEKFFESVSPTFNNKTELISPPTLCTDCRLQRRLAHRNEKSLYNRKCDLTGKEIISIHPPDNGYVIYEKNEWWGDKWDPFEYGRDFDFSRTFFEQFKELQQTVPRMSLQQEHNENSDYTNNVSYLKNCYLLFSADYNRDSCYGIWIERSRDCFDNFLIDECERTYESIFSNKIYNSSFIFFSSQCRDSAFLRDCRGCSDCFMCWGLRNKQYYIANKQYTKNEYFKKRKEFPISSYKNLQACKQQFQDLLNDSVYPYIRKHGRVVDSTGDFLTDTQNCINCYELSQAKDCTNTIGFQMKDSLDCTYVSGEFAYESCECFPTPFHSAFNLNSYTGSDLFYCDLCMNNCQNLFGCVSMRKAQYCIFNKQYSKEGYEKLVPRIIEHMKQGGEWGEFFPIELSPFGYNISEAQQYFPLSDKEVQKNGWRLQEEITTEQKQDISAKDIPDDINDIEDNILDNIIPCEKTGKPFKIIPQELRFYREIGLPIPRRCPDQRHADRLKFRNPRTLFKRACEKCQKEIQTTYSPERPVIVYCEECYLEKVY
ncbi:MAG: hypothetical protein ABIA92_05120 [Patescibacteria group bacterium]